MNKYDKDEIKNNLTFQQVFDYVAEMGGEPRLDATNTNCFISRTLKNLRTMLNNVFINFFICSRTKKEVL